MPPFETLLAMTGFALAASATPGPVNIIGAMTGARYGAARAIAFVTGATTSFLVLFLTLGTGMLAGTGWMLALARPMTLIGSVYLLWMAWGLLSDDGALKPHDLPRAPGFWSGALVQGLNPKAWLAVFSSLAAFVLPLPDRVTGLVVFATLFGLICWLSLMLWAWGGARIGQGRIRLFNRLMALALVLSVAWMLASAFM
ncbi:LysE family translocator [Mesorhizobium sp. SB112]|uniref:LysE family translocator n=1 Tax=Mesorhizobium sp. SB112 TaxID=3151853 RepID=UPI00326493E6